MFLSYCIVSLLISEYNNLAYFIQEKTEESICSSYVLTSEIQYGSILMTFALYINCSVNNNKEKSKKTA